MEPADSSLCPMKSRLVLWSLQLRNCVMTRQNSQHLNFVLVLLFVAASAGAAGAGSAQIKEGPLLAFSAVLAVKAGGQIEGRLK